MGGLWRFENFILEPINGQIFRISLVRICPVCRRRYLVGTSRYPRNLSEIWRPDVEIDGVDFRKIVTLALSFR